MKWLACLVFLSACDNSPSISQEYPVEMSALASEGGSGLPYLAGNDLRPVWNLAAENLQPRKLLSFSLRDQQGKAVELDYLKDKIGIVSFFFSKCPGVCPLTTKNLRKIQEKFKSDSRVVMLSLSITPESDTPGVLQNFAKKNAIEYQKWRLLTGGRKEIYDLARNSFSADTFSARENSRGKLSDKDFLHSENIYLIDNEQRLRGVYAGARLDSIDDLARDAQTLLK